MTSSRQPARSVNTGRAATLVATLLAIACCSSDDSISETPRDPNAPLNVILISLDSVRADHLSCYGYESATGERTSPRLDALAEEGVLFEDAVSTTSWTMAAHHSMLSGFPGLLHGAVDDLHTATPDRTALPDALRQAGYHTAGYYAGPYLHPAFGFARGFDEYENRGSGSPYDLKREDRTKEKLLELELNSWEGASAHLVSESAIDFIERHQADDTDDPFFLFLHYWDPHYDYDPPEERYAKAFWKDYRRPRLNGLKFLQNLDIHPDMHPSDLDGVLTYYDGEIKWVDEQVGRVLDALERLSLEGDTLVIVVADHGDEFFEHGQKGHRHNLYQETLAVPLILRLPGDLPKETRIPHRCSIVDITPTILDYAGVAWDQRGPGVGRSLRPMIEGREQSPREALGDLHVTSGTRSNQWALWTGDHKVIVRTEWKEGEGRRAAEKITGEIYNLREDPDEEHNLLGKSDPQIERAIRRYEEIHRKLLEHADGLRAGPQPAADAAERAEIDSHLERIGYVVATKVSEQPPAPAFPRQ